MGQFVIDVVRSLDTGCDFSSQDCAKPQVYGANILPERITRHCPVIPRVAHTALGQVAGLCLDPADLDSSVFDETL